jgi:hypothetical protein
LLQKADNLNYLKISIKNQGLPEAAMALEVLKETLYRFKVSISPFYSSSCVYLSGMIELKNVDRIQEFFSSAMKQAFNINKLQQQLQPMVDQLAHYGATVISSIRINTEGFRESRYSINLSQQLAALKSKFLAVGFVTEGAQLTLEKNEPYLPENFTSIDKQVRTVCNVITAQSRGLAEAPTFTEAPKKKVESGQAAEGIDEEDEIEEVAEVETHSWLSAKFPAEHGVDLKRVEGAINVFSLWNLVKEDFGHYQDYYDIFHEKSEKKATAELGSSGIKVRPVYSQGKLFPAYIKVAGSMHVGDIGVILKEERDEKGNILYVTSHVDRVHQGL